MNRYICIHGHFYQPPRENPWLEEIEKQDSAFPYHDWNERITAECYAPNTSSRILNEKDKIIRMTDNYAKISFNFGATLLTWMERSSPEVYQAILMSDKLSRNHYSGHGSAIAQVYNHMIMPLANSRDKRTQVLWGLRDFEHRFRRKPEGMWLSETAVDLETLDIMAENGIKFAILSPGQAKQVRRIGVHEWEDVSGGLVFPQMPYVCNLPSGRKISVFFYDGKIAQEVAFQGLLKNGEEFGKRLSSVFPDNQNKPSISHIATDGESYGHHHRFGDMALSYCLNYIESNNLARLTVYGEFLEKYPPSHEVEIIENSSWSCAHGVERWRSNCGCSTGGNKKWNQEWRAPLREAFDWLRDKLIPVFENEIGKYVDSPSEARDDYIFVILDRSEKSVEQFFKKHSKRKLKYEEKVSALKLLEMERHSMFMYTSCGWFFDEVSGIETVQVMRYADRAIQIAEGITGVKLEKEFLKKLACAGSNILKYGNAEKIYEIFVKTARVDLQRVAAHFAISSVFEDYSKTTKIYCYNVKNLKHEKINDGKPSLLIGRSDLKCDITWSEATVSYAVIHSGDHNLICGVSEKMDDRAFEEMSSDIKSVFSSGNIVKSINLIKNKYFKGRTYTLWHLFRDKQMKVLHQILELGEKEIDEYFKHVFEHYYEIVHYLRKGGMELPRTILTAVEYELNCELQKILENDIPETENLKIIISEIEQLDLELDVTAISYVANTMISGLMAKLQKDFSNNDLLQNAEQLVSLLISLPLNLDLWKAQNIFFRIRDEHYSEVSARAEKNEKSAVRWIKNFNKLGEHLDIEVD